MYPQQQAIAITAKYWWMSFIFGLFKPYLTIDGHPVQAAWGRTVVPVPPGTHHVHMHIPYLLPSRIGNADLMVPVHPGQAVEIEYRAPAIGWLDGSMGPAPQQHRGMPAAIVLVALPLVLLLCLCGAFGIAALNDDSSDSLPPPPPLPVATTPFEPSPTTEAPTDKPALRALPARTLVGPAFGKTDETYTMSFGGWPFAFRTPGSWGCLGGKVDLPDAKAYVCIDEGNPGSGQKIQLMVRPCPAPCGAAEQRKLSTEWFDKGAKSKVYDERTSYVETPSDPKGRYLLDMSHFFGGTAGAPRWQVGIGAFTPPAKKADIQKVFNDVLTQAG
jgi:hypothetical protein